MIKDQMEVTQHNLKRAHDLGYQMVACLGPVDNPYTNHKYPDFYPKEIRDSWDKGVAEFWRDFDVRR